MKPITTQQELDLAIAELVNGLADINSVPVYAIKPEVLASTTINAFRLATEIHASPAWAARAAKLAEDTKDL